MILCSRLSLCLCVSVVIPTRRSSPRQTDRPNFSWTFKARTGDTMLGNVHSTSVLRFDCERGGYYLSCSGILRPKFGDTRPGFERPEGLHGGFTHGLRSKCGASSGYPLQLHGV